MKQEKKQDKSYLLALALLLLSGFFVFLFFLPEKDPKPDGKSITQSKKFEETVNRHLFKTSQTMQISRDKMQLEANQLVHRGIGPKNPEKTDVHELDLSTDPRAEALLKALGRNAPTTYGPVPPDQQIQTELFEAQQLEAYSEEYKKEYARQFVENARRAGYLIQLTSDYKVRSVQKLRQPAENFQMFNSDGVGAQ